MMKAMLKDIGKKATFRAPTRWGLTTSTRIIKEVLPNGGVVVRFSGWSEFIVRPHEISKIHEK